MMSGPRLVNNQFNSPIKLYSPESIQETLERQSQVLSNGAVGIDFNKLSKPANLQNSAVLKMLEEEEERKRLGKPGLRRVEWPPTQEGSLDLVDFVEQNPVQSKTRGLGEYATYESKSPTLREEASTPKPNYPASPQQASHFQAQEQPSPRSWTPGTPTSARQQPKEYIIPIASNWKSEAPKPSSPLQTAKKPKSWAPVAPVSPQPTYHQQQQQQQQEYIVPVSCTWKTEAPTSPQVNKPTSWSSAQPKEYIVPVSCPWKSESSQPAPFSQSPNQSWNKPTPSQFSPSADLPTLNTWKPQAQSKPKSSSGPWAPRPQVQIQIRQTPPTPPLNTWNEKPLGSGAGDYPQQHTLTVSQEVQSPQSYYKPQSSAAPFEPPATFITLRQEPPISQEPSPVYYSQPAATEAGYDASSMGRGDNKWPPVAVKEQCEAENRARVELAKGPACRPRKVKKDYSSFFAQHAVTNNYPGYRAPPGTQYFTPAYQQ